ncbi:MAG: hypothetical protein IT292_07110 [Deltaproteobacteria bacterium]|nr:hypothetical protein [Deltaproteobacteria bacterium]
MITNVTIGTVAAFFLVGPLSVIISGLIFGIVLLFFGLLLDLFISLFIGLLAFWLEDISALGWIYFKEKMVFGGYILPVALFSSYLRKVVELLPFRQICYAPSRLMVHFEIDLFWQYLLTQLLWISFFWALACFTFSKGIKNVSINGS